MQRATLELALASEAIYSQVQFAWNSMITCQGGQCMSTPIAKQLEEMSELLKHVESLTFAMDWLLVWTCLKHVESRLLKLDPFALCDPGASTRKLVAYFSSLRKICRCLPKHRGDATRCTIFATWPQRDFNMTLGTRLGRYSKIPGCKMLQDVTRPSETQDLSEVGHLPALCHQIWKKVLGMQGPHDGAVQHFPIAWHRGGTIFCRQESMLHALSSSA